MIKRTIFMLLLALSQLAVQAQQRYILDIKKSKILWRLETMGQHYGDIQFKSGNLNYSSKNEPKDGAFILDMNTMRSLDGNETGIKKVSGMLRNPDFFDVVRYPTSKIEVKKILPTKNSSIFKVMSDLTIKGITQPVEFEVMIKPGGGNLKATGKLLIDRRKWNIAYKPKPDDVFGALKDELMTDDIYITLDLMFYRSVK
jgi:polyisoprenoid-binding protein YceI